MPEVATSQPTFGQAIDGVHVVLALEIDDGRGAELFDKRSVAASRRRQDPRADGLGDLDGDGPDAPRQAVDENEHTKAIVLSVLGLGRGLGLPVAAEEVETPAERRFPAEESCQSVQGYLLGKPALIDQRAPHTRSRRPGPEGSMQVA